MTENVNHPTHYNLPGRKECIKEMEEKYGTLITATFCLTNAYKYIYRAGNKENSSKKQDIQKAIWYYNWTVRHSSAVRSKDLIKLFLDIRKELKKYVND